jgi:putative transposase
MFFRGFLPFVCCASDMSRKLCLVKHLSKGELERTYKAEKDSKVKERLLAILLLYEGIRVQDAAFVVRRGRSTLELWIRDWNRRGVDGLKPRFTGGPKPKVSKTEWDKIVAEIENKAMTIKDVAVYVKDTRGVCYTYKAVWKILRKQRHLRYGKPYKVNKKRPDDAEAILKKG